MKVYELLKIGCDLLRMMTKHDVLRDDWQYVSLFEEYNAMRANRVKHQAAISMLGEQYKISTRTVERIIKRLRGEC